MNFFQKQREELSKREGRLISQNWIARRLDVTSAYVGQWERETCAPNLKLAGDLARIYGVTQERVEHEIVMLTRRINAKHRPQAATA